MKIVAKVIAHTLLANNELQKIVKTGLGINTSDIVDNFRKKVDIEALATFSSVIDRCPPFSASLATGHVFYTMLVMVPNECEMPLLPNIFSSNVEDSPIWILSGSLASWEGVLMDYKESSHSDLLNALRTAFRNHGLTNKFKPC
jgi:hypothetical protein